MDAFSVSMNHKQIPCFALIVLRSSGFCCHPKWGWWLAGGGLLFYKDIGAIYVAAINDVAVVRDKSAWVIVAEWGVRWASGAYHQNGAKT